MTIVGLEFIGCVGVGVICVDVVDYLVAAAAVD